MVLPFVIPHQGLQAFRKRLFYWRVVYNYRLLLQTKGFTENKVEFKFLRVVLLALAIKTIEKGMRSEKEAYLSDYNTRKGNIEAAEKAFWDEELNLHSVDTTVAEQSVYRQRMVDWKFRSNPAQHAKAMQDQIFPFVATVVDKEMA